MKRLNLIIFYLLVLTHSLYSQSWTAKANFGGIARSGAVCFSIGNNGYMGTGNGVGPQQSDFWKWNQTTDTWTQIANIPGSARNHATAFSMGSYGYVIFGNFVSGGGSQFYKYDPSNDTWSFVGIFPGDDRYGTSCFVIGTKAYFIGGYKTTGATGGTNEVWEWDQPTNTWLQLANFPYNTQYGIAFTIGTKGYLGTGANTNQFWEFDPLTYTWTAKANFPGGNRSQAAGFAVNNKGYIGLGVGAGPIYYSDFWEYDPVSNMWTAITGLSPRYSACGYAIGTKGYVGLGYYGGNLNAYVEYSSCTIAPTQPSSILGNTSICFASNNTYSVSSVAGATSYTWTLPSGWTGTSTTNSITTTASSTSGNITVTANNACGSSTQQTLAITVNSIPSTPGTITGNTTICSGTNNTYLVTNDSSATSYTWTLPGGWTGTSTTNSITTTASTTSGNITVTANNSCGSSTAQTLAVTVNSIPSTPGTITGNTTICSGSSNTYSVTNDPSATSYTWILPGGWTGTSTTNSITTTASTTSGNITVTANNSCGSSTAQTLAVTVNSIPSTPGTITGNTTICSVTNNTYSVTNDPSTTSYTWTLPGGWTGTSTTNSITTTASSTSGNITVSANNACGSSSTQTIAVTVNTIPSTPGTISGNTIICSGSSNTYSVINDPTATSYTWTLPGGWTGTSTTNSINTTASSTSGNITVTANNSCGSSSVQTLVVIVNALPNVTASAIDDIVCEGDPTTLTGGGASSYMWTGSVVDGIAFNPTATTSYTVTGTDVNSCSNTATITITVNSLPTVIFNYPGLDTICISYGIQTLSGGSPSGGTYSGTGVTGTNFDPNIAGVGIHTITYFYTDVNSCSSSHNIDIVVLGCAGINESGETTNILVYPNPFTNSISLSNIEELTRINIYNYLGEIIGSWQLDKNNNTIQSEQLRPGIYFITIENSRGTATNKIIKQH